MVIAFALGAGLCYALGAVIQQRVAAAQPPELALRLSLLIALVRRPEWLFGVLLDASAYAFEAAALGVGAVIVVQPLLVSGLLLALPLSTLGGTRRPGALEWFEAAAVGAGIAIFMVVGAPEGGSSDAPLAGWLLVFAVCLGIAGAAVIATQGSPSHSRALGLAIATASCYACTAALTKTVVDGLGDDGLAAALGSWPTYALGAFALLALLLNQSAFQAGHLVASLPALTAVTPLMSSIIGVALFDEHFGATGPVAVTVTAVAGAVTLAGTYALARSPLVLANEGDAHTGDAKEGDAHTGDAHTGDAHEGNAHEGNAHEGGVIEG